MQAHLIILSLHLCVCGICIGSEIGQYLKLYYNLVFLIIGCQADNRLLHIHCACKGHGEALIVHAKDMVRHCACKGHGEALIVHAKDMVRH